MVIGKKCSQVLFSMKVTAFREEEIHTSHWTLIIQLVHRQVFLKLMKINQLQTFYPSSLSLGYAKKANRRRMERKE